MFASTVVGAERWQNAIENVVIALESTLSMVDGSLLFDVDYVEGRIVDAGLGADAAAKRPPKKRAERATKIELLKAEMVKHLQAARDHAYWTKDETGTPQLLPRPTQKELGVRTGMNEADVSRSLNDPEAGELRLYWKVAVDLNEILRWEGGVWRSRSGTGSQPCHSTKASATRT